MIRREAPYIIIVVAGVFTACQKPYAPSVTTINANILVVEGFINAGTDSTFIKLSRTVVVNSSTIVNPETKATVTVENAQGKVAGLTEIVKGTYASVGLNLDNTKQYRIRILTSSGKTYLSSLVDVKITPPIDSVGYTIAGNGIQLYANTHDPNNNTHYYFYTFSEAWQFNVKYVSTFVTNGIEVVRRTVSQSVYSCFDTDSSTNISINSTAALSQDVVYHFPITGVDSNSEKIETRYSILVSQSALTKDAYAFWQSLKTNTENLGSIFDALPSQLVGNINNVADASEPVIGYISAGTIQRKRIFINRAALPNTWRTLYPYTCSVPDSDFYCKPPTIITKGCNDQVAQFLIPKTSSFIILDAFRVSFIQPPLPDSGYTYTSPQCGDCTIRGVAKQPPYWR